MPRHLTTWLLAAYIIAVVSLPAVADEKVPPGSFVKVRASSVEEMVDHVRKDPKIAQRYARHFKVDADKVADYIESELKLVSLKKPLRVTVWFVSKNGRIASKPRVLPEGSMVFSNRDNKPVFLWICGNPLREDLPLATVPTPTPEPEVLTLPTVQELSQPPAEAVPQFLLEAMAPSSVIQGLDTLLSPPSPEMPIVDHKRAMPWWLVGLLFVDSGGHDEVVVVPEVPAGALCSIGLPLAGALARFRRRPA